MHATADESINQSIKVIQYKQALNHLKLLLSWCASQSFYDPQYALLYDDDDDTEHMYDGVALKCCCRTNEEETEEEVAKKSWFVVIN